MAARLESINLAVFRAHESGGRSIAFPMADGTIASSAEVASALLAEVQPRHHLRLEPAEHEPPGALQDRGEVAPDPRARPEHAHAVAGTGVGAGSAWASIEPHASVLD